MKQSHSQSNNQIVPLIFITISVIVIGGMIWLISANSGPVDQDSSNAVTFENGKQVITMQAKGGYFPRTVKAKAGVETILRITTQNTFDCSLGVVIPQLNIRKNLPASGTTDVPIGSQPAGTTIPGTCSMGMYNFTLNFN